MREENLKIVYEEVSDLQRLHQGSVDLLYNKLNWILVSDMVFLAALYSTHHMSLTVLFLVSSSAVLTLIGFQPKEFNITAKISEQLDRVGDTDFLGPLVEKKRQIFNANLTKTKEITQMLAWSRYLLIAAVVLQFLIFFR